MNYILGHTLDKMRARYGTEGKEVIACIGPGISLSAFEVGDAVLSYSENYEKVYPLTGSKTAAGLTINYRMQIKSGLLAEKTMRCVSKTVVMQQS